MSRLVYAAGGSSERLTIVRPMLDQLRSAGIAITHDWTTCPGFDRESTREEQMRWAAEDLDGVRRADLLWLICPAEKSEGAHAELGFALALGKLIVVSGPANAQHRIFPLLAGIHYPSHADALAMVIREAS